MRYHSTRSDTRGSDAPRVGLSAALAAGLAPDGGLYVPEALPRLTLTPGSTLASTAAALLAPFFAEDPLSEHLHDICHEALNIPAPLCSLSTPDDWVLELFHGPTAAFKDFGARFLAACLARLGGDARHILVATSGDTGAAVGAAFFGRPGFRVTILYPDGGVSPRQAHALGSFGGNVRALRVQGRFDDCQRLVKAALNDPALRELGLTSANSISLGRLLPQMAYWAHAALEHHAAGGERLNLVVPTGNLGNALAAILAREVGAPVGEVVLATNANRTLPDYFAGQEYTPRPSVPTVANAMDVGAPSNFERLAWLYRGRAGELPGAFRARAVEDREILDTVRRRFALGELHCPHTAAAVSVLEELRAGGASGDWAVAATAHPAKFEAVLEAVVGTVPVPPVLEEMLARPASAEALSAEYPAFAAWLRANA